MVTQLSKTERAQKLIASILSEEVLTIPQACKALEDATGKRIGRATIHRWMLQGSAGAKLESIKLSSRIVLTSSQAINRFLIAINSK